MWNRSQGEQSQINLQEGREAAQRSEINARKDYNASIESMHRDQSDRWGSGDDDSYGGSSEPSANAFELLVGFVIIGIIALLLWIFVF